MLQFYKKKQWWMALYTPLVIGFLLFLCVVLGQIVYERYTIERDMAERRAAAEADLAALEVRREALQNQVDYLSNERGIEAEMRRNFDIVQPGEKVVIIVENEEENTIMPLATSSPPAEKPWYQFWE
jgi:cell division protein FtsB